MEGNKQRVTNLHVSQTKGEKKNEAGVYLPMKVDNSALMDLEQQDIRGGLKAKTAAHSRFCLSRAIRF
jgi:hypothetical protein